MAGRWWSFIFRGFSVALALALSACSLKGSIKKLDASGSIINDIDTRTILIADASVIEGGDLVFTVSLSTASDQIVTVDWTTADGTATVADSDYVAASGTLTVPAGITTQTITVNTITDSKYESDEALGIELSNPIKATLVDAHAVGAMSNDDAPPTVTFSASTAAIAENGGDISITITQSAASGLTTTIPYSINGTSTATGGGTDYALSPSSPITIAPGATSANIVMTVIDDSAYEGDEIVVLDIGTLTNATIGAVASTTITIQENDSDGAITLSGLGVSGITETGFSASINFLGDLNADAVVTLWYCNQTDSPGCDPTSGTSVTMSRGAGVYTATVAGLAAPIDPGDQLNLRVVATDADGVTGSPANISMSLAALRLRLDSVDLTSVSTTTINLALNVFGDTNSNATVTLWYCNHTDSANCDPTTGSSVAMTRSGSQFLASLGAFSAPNDPGDSFNLRFVASDVDGTINSPLNSTVALANSVNPVYPSAAVSALLVDGSDRRYLGGSFISMDATPNNFSARVFANGQEDTTFDTGEGFDMSVLAFALQPDGKALAGGLFYNYRGTPRNFIARINSNGTLDTSFNPGTGFNLPVLTLALQSDGKVLVGGMFSSFNGTGRNGIARLNSNGTLDTGFNPGTGFAGGQAFSFAPQLDGKVLVGGSFTSFNGTARNRIARLNSNGTLDTSFDPGTGFDSTVRGFALQPDGKALVVGHFTSFNGTNRNGIARLNSDGTLDTSFNPGTGFDGFTQSLVLQPDGKVLVGGSFASFNGTTRNRIARLNSNGTLDTSFDPGTGFDAGVGALALQPDGKVLVGGGFTSFNGTNRNCIARLNRDGTLDTSFSPGTGFNGSVSTLALQPDGKMLAGGSFKSFNGTSRNQIARLNSDGTLDTSFSPGTGFAGGSVFAFALQPDGKLLVGGWFTSFNGTSRNRIARLNSDGSLDTSFAPPGTGLDNGVQSIAVQSDGKVLVAGNFTSFNGTSRNRIVRLNSDGTLDTSFDPGTGFSSNVLTLALQSDGKVLAGGAFSFYDGAVRLSLARLNTDGTLDTSFDTGTGFNSHVSKLVLQPDGKVLTGGWFTDFNGTSRNRIARINSNGTIDTGFDPGTGFNGGAVDDLVLQSDGKVLVGGQFSSFNGTARNRISRLNSNGTIDTSFDPGTGFNSFFGVTDLALQSDGKVLAGGEFTTFNTTNFRPYHCVLNSDGTIAP